MIDPAIASLCAEFGVRVIPRNRYAELGETRAVATLARIRARHGEGHLRLVLHTLTETANNRVCLDEYALYATSDLIRAYGDVVESRAGDWLEAWDRIPVGELQYVVQDLRGFVPQRHALAGMIHERLWPVFGPDQRDMFRGAA